MPNPLIRSEVVRVWVAVLLAAVAAAAVYSFGPRGVHTLFSDSVVVDGWFVVAGVLIVAAPIAAWAIVADERPTRLSAVVKLTGVGVTAVALLVAAALAVREGIVALDEQPRLGTPSHDVALPFVLAALAFLVFALLVAAVRWPRAGRPVTIALGAGLAATVVGIGSAGAVVADHTGCEVFRFSSARWATIHAQEDGDAMAEAIARCHVLAGRTKAQVVRLLGPPTPRQGGTEHHLAWLVTTDEPDGIFFEPGRDPHLIVVFDARGRVDHARYVVDRLAD